MANDNEQSLYLYHATSRERLVSIQKEGLLINAPFNNWDDEYCNGKVFLALDAVAAESYVEAQDDPPEDIAILRVRLSDLDSRYFGRDENNRCPLEETNSCVYFQNISPEFLTECDVNLEPYQDLESFKESSLYDILTESKKIVKSKSQKPEIAER